LAFCITSNGFSQKHKPPSENPHEEKAEGEHSLQTGAKVFPIGKGKQEEKPRKHKTAFLGPKSQKTTEKGERPNLFSSFERSLLQENGKKEEKSGMGVNSPDHP
jgi:hypothetical protein